MSIKKIAMLQPNYMPWKGVFDLINQVDVFVFYDDVQYTSKDWRNRNIIRTPNGNIWLTVPVATKGLRNQLICDAKIDNSTNWQAKHLKTIHLAYKKAKYFKDYEFLLEDIYVKNEWEFISDLDIYYTKRICEILNIEVQWEKSSNLKALGSKDGDKIINICKKLNCNYFINGPSAKSFMNESKFKNANIILDYMSYNYREHPSLYKPFDHYVSVLDLLFNCGPEAMNYIKS